MREAGVDHQEVDAAPGEGDGVERLRDRPCVGDVERHAHDPRAEHGPQLRDEAVEPGARQVRHGDVASLREQRLRDAGADRAGGARDERDVPGQRRLAGPELRALEDMVLHVEQLGLGKPFVGSDRGDRRLHGERVRRDVARDRGGRGVPAGAERAQARREHHARQRVEAAEPAGYARSVALEVGLVRGGVAPPRPRAPAPPAAPGRPTADRRARAAGPSCG